MWIIAFWYMVFCLILLLFMITPLPGGFTFIKAPLIRFIYRVRYTFYVSIVTSAFFGYKAYVGFSSINLKDAATGKAEFMMDLVHRRQRNFYLCLFCFTLSITLLRLAHMLTYQLELESRIRNFEKQPAPATSGASTSSENKKNN